MSVTASPHFFTPFDVETEEYGTTESTSIVIFGGMRASYSVEV